MNPAASAATELDTPTPSYSEQKIYTGTQKRILDLLICGIGPEVVATAAGVTPGYISQLISEEQFSKQLVEARFNNLQSQNKRERNYDEIEDELIAKLVDLIPYMYKPTEIFSALKLVNGRVRKGSSLPEQTVINQQIVNLTLPIQILNKFIKNVNNQVVETGEQTLVTMPAHILMQSVRKANAAKLPQDQELLNAQHPQELQLLQSKQRETSDGTASAAGSGSGSGSGIAEEVFASIGL